jgi:hypothetical protein
MEQPIITFFLSVLSIFSFFSSSMKGSNQNLNASSPLSQPSFLVVCQHCD